MTNNNFLAVKTLIQKIVSRPLPAVISHPKSGIVYIDRYELRHCPILGMGIDGYTKTHAGGYISDEDYQFGLELNKQLKELERMEYDWFC